MPNPNIVEIIDHPSIVLGTAVSLSVGLRPRRIVMRKLEDAYATCIEYMTVRVETRKLEANAALPQRGNALRDYIVCEHDFFDGEHRFRFSTVDENGTSAVKSEELARARALEDYNSRVRTFGICTIG
jgi:hypothetical protein